MINIDSYYTPYFPEVENQFNGHYVFMIDVLRASSTICAALHNGAREIVPFEEIQKAVSVYSNLSKESRFLGGERNGIKPEGFDAGNSPLEYERSIVGGKSIIFTTSNGTKIFNKAKRAKLRIISAFVNIDFVLEKIFEHLKNDLEEKKEINLTFLCAGTKGKISAEDILCAGAYIYAICEKFSEINLTDSSVILKELFNLHKENWQEFLTSQTHAKYLISIDCENDVKACLEMNKYPVFPVYDESSIKI